ncbi:MAG: hypothetical protein QOI10_1338 [Solirubrobacterales bacterium]|jgi:hypothetical protein|nr:hypothetical protein [Solirubrobacterales bacterium]
MNRVALSLALVAVAAGSAPAVGQAADCTRTSVGLTPLSDLGTGTYRGSEGGLYPGGSNDRPATHELAGQTLADAVVPRNGSGAADPAGRYAFVSIGMSNTTQEFSALVPLANADPAKDPRLTLVDGAQGGQTASVWANPNAAPWGVVDQRLAAAGLTPAQVSVAWVKLADADPTNGWPAYAQQLQAEWATVLRNLHDRYPNLTLAYLSSRIYAGYASTALNPEPYAYEGGFSVKWLIGDQLAGDSTLNFDPAAGPVEAPWIAWGPYLWADGLSARSDGLTWACSELQADGTHPSPAGQAKVAGLLLQFLKADSTARLWFSPPQPSPRTISLALHGHLKARGAVATAGFLGCLDRVAVKIQRRARHGWHKAGADRTDETGSYQASLADRPGAYRARVATDTVGAEGDSVCEAATSKHRHSRA